MLEGGRSLTRPEIGERLAAAGVAAPAGMRLSYLVMRAELDGLIVSGPLRGQQHTYALLAERLAGRPTSTPDDPLAELWRRFVVGHGPASVRDFARWSSLTLTAARAAADRVADRLESATIGEEELWWDPATPDAEPAVAREVVRLLPLYDELPLSYPRLNFPPRRRTPAPARRRPALGLGDRRADQRGSVAADDGRGSTACGPGLGCPCPGDHGTSAGGRGHRAGPAGGVPRRRADPRGVGRTMTTAGNGHVVLAEADSAPLRFAASATHLAQGAVRAGQEAAEEGAALLARKLGRPGRPTGSGRADPAVAPGPARLADPDPGGPDGRLAVRVPAGQRDRDGQRRRVPAGHRHHPGDLRRRAPGELRLLRLARGRAGDRPERLRRSPPRRLGVGPAAAGGQHLGRRSGERQQRAAVRGLGRLLRPGVPGRGRVPGRRAPADALLQPAGRPSAARDGHREDAAGRDRTVGETGPPPDLRPCAAPVHPRAPRAAADRRGAAADHPRDAGRGGRHRRGAGRLSRDAGAALAPGGGWLHDRYKENLNPNLLRNQIRY